MKRLVIRLLLCAVLLTGVFALGASAENNAGRVEMYCTIDQDGNCLVSMTVNLHLESANPELQFPLPAGAKDIKVNGGACSTSSGSNAILVNLKSTVGSATGDIPIRFDYALPGVVTAYPGSKTQLQLNLPLLQSFAYPILNYSFVITMPDNLHTLPNFYSIYQQNGFESDLDLALNSNMVTGTAKRTLRDHEEVSMNMLVPPSMFPGVSTYQREGNPELVPMGICAGIAFLYWLLFLRTLPLIPSRCTNAPAGVSAGELSCRLTMTGGDLTLMVLTWAQLGYLTIQLTDKGHVLLRKRMDMGNERNLFEVRTFQSLFGKLSTVDCAGLGYAKLCAKTAAVVPNRKMMVRSRYASRRVFRAILCVGQIFCGICMAMNMTSKSFPQIILSVLFGIAAVLTAWALQSGPGCLFLRKKSGLVYAGISFLFWLVVGLIAGQPLIACGAAAVQFLFGFFSAYGGRRTDRNRTEASEILGLRSFLKNLDPAEAKRLQQFDPFYFFAMAPYAMALGVGKPFAAAFGKLRLDQCPYFATRIQGQRSAADWMRIMNQTVSTMDERYRRLKLERWLAIRLR